MCPMASSSRPASSLPVAFDRIFLAVERQGSPTPLRPQFHAMRRSAVLTQLEVNLLEAPVGTGKREFGRIEVLALVAQAHEDIGDALRADVDEDLHVAVAAVKRVRRP